MNHYLQKTICSVLIFSSCFLMKAYAEPAWPVSPDIQAEAGIVVDADSGAVLGEKNADTPYPPASITKLLTALVVLEHADLKDTVDFSDRAVNNVESDGGNKLNVAAGDKLTVEECLYSLLMQSCNQVANALAEHVAGSQEAFVGMMNAKAKALGCTNSHFDNPSGLNGDTQNVTARDMALIARAAFDIPELVKISSSLSYQMPPMINNPDGITIYAENKLILNTSNSNSPYCYPSVKGGKTGYLKKAGNTLVTYAKQDGKRLISVILKGSAGQYYLDGKSLLEFGFDNFDNFDVSIAKAPDTPKDAPVTVGVSVYQPSQLSLQPGKVTLPRGAAMSDTKHELVTEFPKDHPNASVAFIRYTYQGRSVGGAYLTADKGDEAESLGEGVHDGRQDQGGKPEDEGGGVKTGSSFNPVFLMIPLLLAILSAGTGFVIHSRGKQEKASAIRREQRRKRLQQEGVSEAEFQRLLNERLKGHGKKRRK